jgi:Ribonuclease G/E
MSKLTIRIENHQQKFTVSEMRKRLAQVLSKLEGNQEVSFTFVATLESYQSATAKRMQTEPAQARQVITELRDEEYADHSGLSPALLYGELSSAEKEINEFD